MEFVACSRKTAEPVHSSLKARRHNRSRKVARFRHGSNAARLQSRLDRGAGKRAALKDAGDSAEIAGQTIIGLLNQAADAVAADAKHAPDVIQELSRQLRVAEGRIADLEADLRYYRDRAERAEKWLNHISSEIERRFHWLS